MVIIKGYLHTLDPKGLTVRFDKHLKNIVTRIGFVASFELKIYQASKIKKTNIIFCNFQIIRYDVIPPDTVEIPGNYSTPSLSNHLLCSVL